MNTVHPGYMGVANVAGTIVRFSDASITAKQDVQIPDMVMGHWDRAAYNFGKVEIGGGLSGPVTESFANAAGNVAASIWDWGYSRGDCGGLDSRNVTLTYFCDGAMSAGNYNTRTFNNLMVQNLGFSCAAGDVAQFTMELIGATVPVWSNSVSAITNTTTEKLVTWDNVGLTITQGDIVIAHDALLSNFDFSIANNITAVYAMNQAVNSGFYPEALVPGIRTITGSISCYDPRLFDGVAGFNRQDDGSPWAADGQSTLEFNIGGTTITFLVQFHRVEPKLGVGPIISTVAFTGVGVQAETV